MIGKKPINDLHMVSQWLIGAFGCMVWNQRKFLDFMITMETKKDVCIRLVKSWARHCWWCCIPIVSHVLHDCSNHQKGTVNGGCKHTVACQQPSLAHLELSPSSFGKAVLCASVAERVRQIPIYIPGPAVFQYHGIPSGIEAHIEVMSAAMMCRVSTDNIMEAAKVLEASARASKQSSRSA
jgi:hypothetical protein